MQYSLCSIVYFSYEWMMQSGKNIFHMKLNFEGFFLNVFFFTDIISMFC